MSRRRQRIGRFLAVGIVTCFAAVPTWFADAAEGQATRDEQAESPAFSGSAGASAVRMTLNVPSAPLTETPLDGGGPTAQVQVDSVGTSAGYAAFPDSGEFVVSLPGLLAGVLAGRLGTPPPSPPPYPFFVASDASSARERSEGAGPYRIAAQSEEGAAKASAVAGFESGLVGNVALLRSTASIEPDNGEVIAEGVSIVEGMVLGPLAIGKVESKASQTLDASGAVTPQTELRISGLRIGGVGVEVAPQGLVVGGPTVPLALNDTFKQLLGAANVTVEVMAPQSFPNRVIAPALRITFPFAMPVAVPNVGQFSGTATVILGFATASMRGVGAGSGEGPGGVLGDQLSSGAGAESAATLNGGVGGLEADPPGAAASVPQSIASPGTSLTGAEDRVLGPAFDIRSLYLVLIGAALVVIALAPSIIRMGLGSWSTTSF